MIFVKILIPIFLGFREGFEAILVVIIMMLYPRNSDQRFYYKYVYLGSILAILSSIVFALIFTTFLGGFTGIMEELFEGFTFIISGFFIITLILWMSKEGPKMKGHIEEKIEKSIQTKKLFSIMILAFIIIIREGVELVLMLTGATSVGTLLPIDIILGTLIGIGIASGLGLTIFYSIKTINLLLFFKVTNIILVLFAAGLITYGLHELIEAGFINPIIEEVWNFKSILPESFPDGNPVTPEWLEVIGSLLKALFGYNANPSLLEIIIYPTLIISIGIISLKLWKRTSNNPNRTSIHQSVRGVITNVK